VQGSPVVETQELRPLLVAALVAAVLLVPSVAVSQTAAEGPSSLTSAKASSTEHGVEQDQAKREWGDKRDDGYRKGMAPAKGTPYNVKHMALAAVVMGLMALFLFWLIRRNTCDRAD